MKTMKIFSMMSAMLIAGVITVNAGAFAEETPTYKNTYTGESATQVNGTSIPLIKSIVMINATSCNVYEPNITYNYTVVGIDPNSATVTDGDSDRATVNRGVAGGVTGTSIIFSSGNDAVPVPASPNGTELERSANLTVDLTKFTHAGIYRYCVTETTTSENVQAVGMEARDASYDNTRYLDVYIANNGNGLELAGAVFFKTTKTASGQTAGTDSITTTTTDKTTGFEPGTEPTESGQDLDYANDGTVDRYKTYNITVKKEVAGSFADKENEFPFAVKLTNSIANAKYTYKNDSGNETAETIANGTITKGTANASNNTLTLKHNDSVTFIGVPSNADTNTPLKIEVSEYNNTSDKYTATVTANATIALDDNNGVMNANETAGFTGDNAYAVKTNDVVNHTITFTNTLDEISPTGLVFRVAPYVTLIGGAVMLIAFCGTRKKENKLDNV